MKIDNKLVLSMKLISRDLFVIDAGGMSLVLDMLKALLAYAKTKELPLLTWECSRAQMAKYEELCMDWASVTVIDRSLDIVQRTTLMTIGGILVHFNEDLPKSILVLESDSVPVAKIINLNYSAYFNDMPQPKTSARRIRR